MEHGFFHPDRGYFQTISTPSEELIASFPSGTVEVPLKPGQDFEWDGSEWLYVAPPPPSREQQQESRADAYKSESDPLYFKAQRGEATMDEWLALVAEIKTRYPYP
tara:strand:- start:116 stop:433 length:318 start_codon:yes stop_codon:yes gene_type:complete